MIGEVRAVAGAPVLVWRLARPLLVVSSAPLGGGLGPRSWVVNATVGLDYDRRTRAFREALMAKGVDTTRVHCELFAPNDWLLG